MGNFKFKDKLSTRRYRHTRLIQMVARVTNWLIKIGWLQPIQDTSKAEAMPTGAFNFCAPEAFTASDGNGNAVDRRT